MKRLLPAALLLISGPAVAQDRSLTAEAVLDLARREAVWCEEYREATRDCEGLYVLRQEPDGSLVSSAMFLLTERPRVEFLVAEVVRLEGDRLCSEASAEDLNIQATVEGQPAPAAMVMAIREIYADNLAEYEGRTICQRLLATADPDVLHEEITVDEARLPEFETTYRLGARDSGFLLRPIVEAEEDPGRVEL